MSLTRRGYAVLAVVLLGLANAGLYGPRALNAVVAPAAVALLAAVVGVRRIDRPDLERVVVDEGFVGETHTVELRFSAATAFTGHIRDAVPEGLATSGNELTTAIEETTLAYDVTFARRGAHELGPVTVTARDVLGLVERTFTYPGTREVLVYPRIRSLTGRARHELNLLPDLELVANRGGFDSLREYQRGDALRDIDWKSSAGQPEGDLIVKEYVDEDDLGEVHIAARTDETRRTLGDDRARESADAMAEATASIADFLLEAGLSVGVTVPDGSVAPGEAHDQMAAILELLARTGPGGLPGGDRETGDMLVHADGGDVVVRMAGQQVPFERLTGDTADAPTTTTRRVGG